MLIFRILYFASPFVFAWLCLLFVCLFVVLLRLLCLLVLLSRVFVFTFTSNLGSVLPRIGISGILFRILYFASRSLCLDVFVVCLLACFTFVFALLACLTFAFACFTFTSTFGSVLPRIGMFQALPHKWYDVFLFSLSFAFFAFLFAFAVPCFLLFVNLDIV